MAAASEAPRPDYSLYLVTDVTPAILGSRSLEGQVRAACAGGVTIVQHRDKTSDTSTLIRDVRTLHRVTKQYGVPLLINDRVDVALAVGCEGVHLGQEDMDLATARRLLGPSKLIGISVSNPAEAAAAVSGGADYVGIGTMFGTPTKKDTKSIIGTDGTQAVLAAIAAAERERGSPIGAVAIGGINASNARRVAYQSAAQTPHLRPLDGIAAVSALIASVDPKAAAGTLRRLLATAEEATPFATLVYPPDVSGADLAEAYVGRDVPALVSKVRTARPLCHNMTNLVVQNFAANVALAVGGSPIMAGDGGEAPDLARLGGSLVVNMGSAAPGALEHFGRAITAYNDAGGPVLLDPVGAGATTVRRAAVRTLLAAGYFDLIKGNESEILAVAGALPESSPAGVLAAARQQRQQRGVDGGGDGGDGGDDGGLTLRQKAQLVRAVAAQRRCIVLMTGRLDFLSDGVRVLQVANGHAVLGDVTGTGCALGTTVAAFLAVEKQDKLLAALAGLLLYEIAAEEAAKGADGQEGESVGPGSFVPAFIDQLSRVSKAAEGFDWVGRAKVQPVDVDVNGEVAVR